MSAPDRAYEGGKGGAGVWQSLISMMPRHTLYLEPFLGGGSVLRRKRPAACSIAVERDATVLAQRWRGDEAPGLQLVHGDAFAILLELASLESARSDRASGLAKPVRSDERAAGPSPEVASAATLAASGETRRHASPGLAGLERSDEGAAGPPRQIGRVDPAPIFPALVDPATTLVYCDPPYLMATRTCRRPRYRHELSTEAEHRRLLELLLTLRSRVMISGYWSEFYARMLANWRVESYWTVNRRGRRVQEFCWLNFPRPTELHDPRWIGVGYRERERIKRRQQRWRARLEKMPEWERQALLAVLQEPLRGVPGSAPASPHPAGASRK